jgi:glycosyltransferase A (GT-A) superfamily protein (DUF2064 family)
VTRAPGAPGGKTRLARAVGHEACRRLQHAFFTDTLAWAQGLTARRVLSVHPPERAEEVGELAPGWTVVPQVEPDFGERLRAAVNSGFDAGPGPVAMIATDSPSLPPSLVEDAWRVVAGADVDVALAPSNDGGWVLIATAAPLPAAAFDRVRWTHESTLHDTEASLARCGVRSARLRPWFDVDDARDVERLMNELDGDAARRLPHTAAVLRELPGRLVS